MAETNNSLPLHQAAKSGNIEQLRSILSSNKSIDPNQEDENGVTALIEACLNGHKDIAQILIEEAECPAQPLPPFRHTPLRGATVCGQYDVIPFLLAAGADPNSLSDGNRTPLMGACFLRNTVNDGKNHEEISAKCVKAMLDDPRTDPTIANSFGETALDLAKIRGYVESVKLLEDALEFWNSKV